eukprot:749642-Hanusia_phi.AAC.1
MDGSWNYDACDGLGFACHFLPLSRCSSSDAMAEGSSLHKRMDEIHYDNPRAYDSHFIPPEFASPYHGILWWRSQVGHWQAGGAGVEG